MRESDSDVKERGAGTNTDPGMVPSASGGFRAADPWEMEKPIRRSDADLNALYADDSTRPIVHGLVAAIGYINGQSVNSAAVMTAALKVALKALEKLQEQKAEMRTAISDARRDIAEWVQLGERQFSEMPNAGFQPLAPTEAGIKASKDLMVRIGKAGR